MVNSNQVKTLRLPDYLVNFFDKLGPNTEVKSNLFFGTRNSGYIAFDQHNFTIAFANNLIQI